ncbi:MAG: hypothetical protein FJ095_05555 [Deltaproteobacteria bacterium]|nr:hypothetical protein [Deltaproteobacteria bacterium]
MHRPRRLLARLASLAAVAALLLVAFRASAEASPHSADGAYGRLDGDLLLGADATVTLGEDGGAVGARVVATYLTMVGLYAAYDEGVGAAEQPLVRRFAGGIGVRPLFLGRFVSDLERGPALLDLWLDSFGLELGAFVGWREHEGCHGACRVDGLEVAGTMTLPLLSRVSGPSLGLRAGARAPLGGEATDLGPEGFLTLSLGYQALVATGLVDSAR